MSMKFLSVTCAGSKHTSYRRQRGQNISFYRYPLKDVVVV